MATITIIVIVMTIYIGTLMWNSSAAIDDNDGDTDDNIADDDVSCMSGGA